MDPIVKVLVLKNESKVLVTKIREVQSELGEPDCQLTDPVELEQVKKNGKKGCKGGQVNY